MLVYNVGPSLVSKAGRCYMLAEPHLLYITCGGLFAGRVSIGELYIPSVAGSTGYGLGYRPLEWNEDWI